MLAINIPDIRIVGATASTLQQQLLRIAWYQLTLLPYMAKNILVGRNPEKLDYLSTSDILLKIAKSVSSVCQMHKIGLEDVYDRISMEYFLNRHQL
jgi:hypothetical protein